MYTTRTKECWEHSPKYSSPTKCTISIDEWNRKSRQQHETKKKYADNFGKGGLRRPLAVPTVLSLLQTIEGKLAVDGAEVQVGWGLW